MSKFQDLERIARSVRRKILLSIYHAGSGHPGGALSCADILVYLYFREMNISNPNDPERDRFILLSLIHI